MSQSNTGLQGPVQQGQLSEKTTSSFNQQSSGTSSSEDRSPASTINEKPSREGSISSQSSTKKPNKPIWRRTIDMIFWFMKDQWFLIALGILVAISSQVQVPASQQQMKTTVIDYLCVAVIFFINGCTMSTKSLLNNLARWEMHLFVQVLCFLMCSAVAFGTVSAAASNHNFMDPALLIGMLVLGCLPTAIAFNVAMSKQAHGNHLLCITESNIGNFLGPFISPVLIRLYLSAGAWYTGILPAETGGYGEIYRRVFKQLGLSIFLPLFVGQIVQNLIPKICNWVFVKHKISKAGSLSLLVIIWSTFDAAFQTNAWAQLPPSNIAFMCCMCVIWFCIWFGIAFIGTLPWARRYDAIAAIYCIPSKTPAMGVPLAQVMFLGLSQRDLATIKIPMVIFQGFSIMLSSLSTIPLRGWTDRGVEAEKQKAQADEEAKIASPSSSNSDDSDAASTHQR